MAGVRIQEADPTDAAQIANLFGCSFPPEVAQLLIYGCKGASEYIRKQISSRPSNIESLYFVAKVPEGIIGAAELRRQPDKLFLNYIAVTPEYRRHRIATALLKDSLRMTGVESGQFALDVLHDNVPALNWYLRLGFRAEGSTEFLELRAPGERSAAAYISGLPQADLSQEWFGFSTFNIITSQGTFPVGRIGDSWFRLTNPEAAGNPEVFAALQLLDSSRRIFGIIPALSIPAGQVIRLLTKTCRMEMEIPKLIASLCDDHQGR